VRDDDLILPHTARIAEVLRIALSRLTVEEVARSTDLRPQIEARLGEELPRLLEEYGLSFKGVIDLRLVSPQIERVRESEGLISSTERELRWAKQKREREQGHKLTEIKDEFAFKEQVDRWTHEYALTSMEREHVIGMYQIAREKERQLADVERVGVVRLTAQEYELQERRKEELLRDELERLRQQREHDAERERIRLKKEGDMSDVEILNEMSPRFTSPERTGRVWSRPSEPHSRSPTSPSSPPARALPPCLRAPSPAASPCPPLCKTTPQAWPRLESQAPPL
jgi:hypothetical protein